MYIYIYICIAHCLLPIAYCLLPIVPQHAAEAATGEIKTDEEAGFMRHGHEMLWFPRWFFSESELPLSYNAFP